MSYELTKYKNYHTSSTLTVTSSVATRNKVINCVITECFPRLYCKKHVLSSFVHVAARGCKYEL
jgi:hypothetical protein